MVFSHDYTPRIMRLVNVKRNADGLLAKQVHNNDSLLWSGGKRVPSDKFGLSY